MPEVLLFFLFPIRAAGICFCFVPRNEFFPQFFRRVVRIFRRVKRPFCVILLALIIDSRIISAARRPDNPAISGRVIFLWFA